MFLSFLFSFHLIHIYPTIPSESILLQIFLFLFQSGTPGYAEKALPPQDSLYTYQGVRYYSDCPWMQATFKFIFRRMKLTNSTLVIHRNCFSLPSDYFGGFSHLTTCLNLEAECESSAYGPRLFKFSCRLENSLRYLSNHLWKEKKEKCLL